MRGPSRDITRQDVFHEMQTQESREWTVEELATNLDCSTSTVYNRLRELHSMNRIETRKSGQSRYWWVAPTVTA